MSARSSCRRITLSETPRLIPPPVVLDIAAEGPAAPVFRISRAEPWRVVRTRQRAADPVLSRRLPPTELFATGFFTSATGVTIYRGSAYPPNYRGNVFVGDVGGNLVHRKILSAVGATFLATPGRRERRVPRVDRQLVSAGQLRQHARWDAAHSSTCIARRSSILFSIPEPIKKHLDLTSGKDRGRLYNLVYSGVRAAGAAEPEPGADG